MVRDIPSWLVSQFSSLSDKETGTVLSIWKTPHPITRTIKHHGLLLWNHLEEYGVSSTSAQLCCREGRSPLNQLEMVLSADSLWQHGDDGSAWAWMRVCLEATELPKLKSLLPLVDDWGLSLGRS